jgi:uncharacterized membrane protein
MRLSFQRDLLIVVILTFLSLIFAFMLTLNKYPAIIVPFFLLLFLTGYSITAALYPDQLSLKKYSMLAITLGLSLLILFIIVLLGIYAPFKISNEILFMFLSLITILMVIIAFLRRTRPSKTRSSKKMNFKPKKAEEPEIGVKAKETEVAVKAKETEMDAKSIEHDMDKRPVKRGYFGLDLLVILFLTLITVVFVILPPLNDTFIRTILGLFLILFIPGYSLIAFLFPKKDDLDGIERLALSFGLSIAITPLIGLALNYTPWGIRLDPILVVLSVFTILMVAAAYIRRLKVPEKSRFSVDFAGFFKSLRGTINKGSKADKILSVILIISIILAISTTVYIIVKPKEGEKFTEFYLLGPGGKASDYPTNLTTGQNAMVIIGIVNHEYANTTYNLVVRVNGTVINSQNVTLINDQKVEIPFNFTANSAGQKKMEFLLYKLPNNSDVYRSLHLWLQIS